MLPLSFVWPSPFAAESILKACQIILAFCIACVIINVLCPQHQAIFNRSNGSLTLYKTEELKTWLLNKDTHKDSNCVLITFIAHGNDKGHLTDMDYTDAWKLDDFIEELSKVKTLLGKPKILVVQACRGGKCWLKSQARWLTDVSTLFGVKFSCIDVAAAHWWGLKWWQTWEFSTCYSAQMTLKQEFGAHLSLFCSLCFLFSPLS